MNMPKTIGMAFAALLLAASAATAQEKVFAYNTAGAKSAASKHIATEVPVAFKVKLLQPEKDALVFRLSVENPGADKVILMIKDRNSNVLHREVIPATPVFTGRYNLQGLEDGDYTFELRSGKNRIAQKTVEIKTELSVNRTGSVE